MTLADAIRKGSAQREQAFEALAREATLGAVKRGILIWQWETCAIGAGIEGLTGVAPRIEEPETYGFASDDIVAFETTFAEALGRPATCPGAEGYRGIVHEVIIHLNDYHRWTRERIADWLDTLEATP